MKVRGKAEIVKNSYGLVLISIVMKNGKEDEIILTSREIDIEINSKNTHYYLHLGTKLTVIFTEFEIDDESLQLSYDVYYLGDDKGYVNI